MTTETLAKARRSGGRNAKVATRAAPLADNLRPIRAGMAGGTFKPLSDIDIAKIHQGALKVLEEIGLSQAPQTGIDAMTAAGAILSDDGRLRFPRALVEDMVAKAGRNFTLHARDPKHDFHPSGNKVHFGTGGAAVHLIDMETKLYRDSNLQDLFNAARIADQLDNVHFFQRCMVPRDMEKPMDMDLNTLYACLAGTSKHVGTSFVEEAHAAAGLKMLHEVAGGEAEWRAKPFVSNSNCFVVPPLKFATESCEIMETLIRGGMPILLLSAGQAGATAPAAIAGAVTQAVAECLAGVVYVNSISPGHPAIFGTWPFVSDLRTGAMSGGSAEQGLLSAACGQMAQFYDIPGGAPAGMSDSKLLGNQSGYEKGITALAAGLAGQNMIYEAAGMHASLLGFCLESLIMDNDMLGQALRVVRGIEVNDETLSFDVMKSVSLEGPGHYLGHDQTIALMQTEYVYPALGDRTSPKEWIERGMPNEIDTAIAAKHRILNSPIKNYIPDAVDDAIREAFHIGISKENTGR